MNNDISKISNLYECIYRTATEGPAQLPIARNKLKKQFFLFLKNYLCMLTYVSISIMYVDIYEYAYIDILKFTKYDRCAKF